MNENYKTSKEIGIVKTNVIITPDDKFYDNNINKDNNKIIKNNDNNNNNNTKDIDNNLITKQEKLNNDIEDIFIKNVGKMFGDAISTYIITQIEENYNNICINGDGDSSSLLAETIKALAKFILSSSPESNESIINLYRAEKNKLTKMVKEYAIETHIDNPFKRAIMRHTTSGDISIIPFLEQDIKMRNPSMTSAESIRVVTRFKNDLINIFCTPLIESITNISPNSIEMRNDFFLAIIDFVENDSSFKKNNNFTFSNFTQLIYNLNLLYIKYEKDKTGKTSISLRDLEALKKYFNKHVDTSRLASDVFFFNDKRMTKLPVKLESVIKIANFLMSIQSIEEIGVFCPGIFGYITYLMRQCLINKSTDNNKNYYENLKDLDNTTRHEDIFSKFDKQFKTKLKHAKTNLQNRKEYDSEESEYYSSDNECTQITNRNNSSDDDTNHCYLASGIFGDDSIFGNKLINLVESGDITGLQELTNYILSIGDVKHPSVVQYINNLIDIIFTQNERLRNVRPFNNPLSMKISPVTQNKLDILKDSVLASIEIAKTPLSVKYELEMLCKIDCKKKKFTHHKPTMFIVDNICDIIQSSHNLYSAIFHSLIQKAFPNDKNNKQCTNMLKKNIDIMSPFGSDSVSSCLYAIEFVSVTKDNSRTLHYLKDEKSPHGGTDEMEILMKINTAIESSLLNESTLNEKKKIVDEAQILLRNKGAAIIKIIEHAMVIDKNRRGETTTIASSPYSVSGLIKGILSILSMTMNLTKLKNNTSLHSNDEQKAKNVILLTLVPEIIEWLIKYLVSQVEAAMASLIHTKLPIGFDEYIYEQNKGMITTNNTQTDIGNLFIQVMANDYLNKIDNALNAPKSTSHTQLREQLVKLVIEKSYNVLNIQCCIIITMAILIAIDHKRQLPTNVNETSIKSDKKNLSSYLGEIDENIHLKKHIKDVVSAVCLSVAKDAAVSFARLSNSHFKYILQKFNIKPHSISNLSHKRISNNENKSKIARYMTHGKRQRKPEEKSYHWEKRLKKSNVNILDEMINKYNKSK
nr:MAG: wsv271-like protein [Metapenaeopsis lamellata majanivirus]